MNTDDRQQQREQAPADAGAERSRHIATLAAAIVTRDHYTCPHGSASSFAFDCADCTVAAIFDSTDPAVHDALTAALHANADRARILAAHADAGWLEREGRQICAQCFTDYGDGHAQFCSRPGVWKYVPWRYVTPWEPTP